MSDQTPNPSAAYSSAPYPLVCHSRRESASPFRASQLSSLREAGGPASAFPFRSNPVPALRTLFASPLRLFLHFHSAAQRRNLLFAQPATCAPLRSKQWTRASTAKAQRPDSSQSQVSFQAEHHRAESPLHSFKQNTPTPYAADEPGAATHPFPRPTGAEDQTAILLPQGPIPTPDDYSPRRIPHLGHALAFVLNTGIILVLAQAVFLALAPPVRNPHTGAHMIPTTLDPKLLLASMAIAYVVTLIEAWTFFPLLWHRTFLEGIRWNYATARHNAWRLIPLGLV